jgi:error-prone DNA polymerase
MWSLHAAHLCAMLSNQPMGFYSTSTLISDAKLHGLKSRPIDVQYSEWSCTLEALDESGQRFRFIALDATHKFQPKP